MSQHVLTTIKDNLRHQQKLQLKNSVFIVHYIFFCKIIAIAAAMMMSQSESRGSHFEFFHAMKIRDVVDNLTKREQQRSRATIK